MTRKKLSRRKFFGATAGAAMALGATPVTVSSAQGPAVTGVPGQDLVLTNGNIHTMDARNTVARAVTIRNGRFVTIGNSAARTPGARVIDLKGPTVVPGLVEGHIHIVSLANRPGYHTI